MSPPFASLPIELVLSVIAFAADHQPSALALSFVSSWVHTHVEPVLYHTIHLRSARSLVAFIATLDRKPHGFADRTVKRLCITALGPIASIRTVLTRCTGVASLACGFSVPAYVHGALSPHADKADDASGTLGRLPVTPREQHLFSLACRDGLHMAIMSPSVSHLRIQLTSAVSSESVAGLAALPRLTHLALVINAKEAHSRGLEAILDMLGPILDRGALRLLVLQFASSTGNVVQEDVRRWAQIEREKRSSRNAIDGEKRADLVVSTPKAPWTFLSEWEESDRFWQRARDSVANGSVVA